MNQFEQLAYGNDPNTNIFGKYGLDDSDQMQAPPESLVQRRVMYSLADNTAPLQNQNDSFFDKNGEAIILGVVGFIGGIIIAKLTDSSDSDKSESKTATSEVEDLEDDNLDNDLEDDVNDKTKSESLDQDLADDLEDDLEDEPTLLDKGKDTTDKLNKKLKNNKSVQPLLADLADIWKQAEADLEDEGLADNLYDELTEKELQSEIYN